MLEGIDEVLEIMRIEEEPPIETFVESESATNFKGFEAPPNIVRDIDDRLFGSENQTETKQTCDEMRRFSETLTSSLRMSSVKKNYAFTANDRARHRQTKYEP